MIRDEKDSRIRQERDQRIVVIGVGNPYRHDDGAGLLVARRLQEMDLEGVAVYESPGEAAALMELWKEAEVAVLVDAVSAGSPVGHVHRLEAHRRPLPADLFNHSTHGFGLAQAVELGRTFGCLPPTLIIYGIEGGDFSVGRDLTMQVVLAVNQVVDQVSREVRAWRELHRNRKDGQPCTNCP